jgi:hypothetical protein
VKTQNTFVTQLLSAISLVTLLVILCNNATVQLISVNQLDVGNKAEILEITQEELSDSSLNYFSFPYIAVIAHFFGKSFFFNIQKSFSADRCISVYVYVSKYPLYILFHSLRIFS